MANVGCLINALLLISTFHSWRFAYFWLDDFNNLYWVRGESIWAMLWHNINPASDFHRPFGMLFYWIFWRAFDLDPLPYHLFAWALHAANVWLLYILLSRIVRSPFAAAVGAMLFGFRANFVDIYWSFGTIFELLACNLIFVALLVYSRRPRSYLTIVAVCVLYILAIKSKEMAITLPAVLFLYDVCLGESRHPKRILTYSILAVIALWFVYFKVTMMGSASPDNPYYMDFSVLTFGRGYGWYFDRLYDMRLRWGAWMITSVLLFCLMAYKREKRGVFFLGYIFVSLLPVVFLVNHRFPFYWYIPFFGVSGLAAVLVGAFESNLRRWLPTRAVAVMGLTAFLALSAAHYFRETRESRAHLESQRSTALEYASFVQGLRNLPQPPSGETIYYKSFPPHFDLEVLRTTTQVALDRTDIHVEIVSVFPEPCGYCFQFENASLMRNRQER